MALWDGELPLRCLENTARGFGPGGRKVGRA